MPMQKQIFEFMGRRIELWTHPDPDHMAYVRSLTPEHECAGLGECLFPHLGWQGVHTCDGCCKPPRRESGNNSQ